MFDYGLSKQELAELRAAHRRALNVREAYRINAVILLGNGRTAADVAATLAADGEFRDHRELRNRNPVFAGYTTFFLTGIH